SALRRRIYRSDGLEGHSEDGGQGSARTESLRGAVADRGYSERTSRRPALAARASTTYGNVEQVHLGRLVREDGLRHELQRLRVAHRLTARRERANREAL